MFRLKLHNIAENCCRLSKERIELKNKKPWYVGWSVCQSAVARNLHNLYSRPSFLSEESTPPSKPWIFIGKYPPNLRIFIGKYPPNLPNLGYLLINILPTYQTLDIYW